MPEALSEMPASEKSKFSGLAIAALICSLLSLFIIPGILAIIFGIVALVKIDKQPMILKGKGLAVTSIVLGALGLLMITVLSALAAPTITLALERAQLTTELNEMRSYSLAFYNYSSRDSGQLNNPEDLIDESFYSSESYNSLLTIQNPITEDPWVFYKNLSVKSPGSSVLLMSPVINDKRVVIYINGSVKALSIAEATQILADQSGEKQEIPYITQ